MSERTYIGDFFEFDVAKGFGHFLVTHFHPEYGHLIQVLGAAETEKLTDYSKIYQRTKRQRSFYPIEIGLRDGLIWKVGHFEIPDHLKEFPQFRSNVRDKSGAYSTPWTIWDGENFFTIEELGEGRYLPIREIITHSVMVERVDQKYRVFYDI